ncbi:MAG TPA: nucleotidyltransferase family protein, partial [Bacteroidales bacterium]|nr:nucleotidyltransferase family protein [Bacteroidales bacterium]
MALNPNDNRLFSLLMSGLWGIPPPSDLFIGINEEDWQYIFKQASKQGLMGIVYDGLSQSNKTVLPRSLQLTWAVNVDAMEQRYNKHYQTLEQLTALYRQEGIRLMLLKGLGLAAAYP